MVPSVRRLRSTGETVDCDSQVQGTLKRSSLENDQVDVKTCRVMDTTRPNQPQGPFEVGDRLRTSTILHLRSDKCLLADCICELPPDNHVEVLHVDRRGSEQAQGRTRALVLAGQLSGWVTLTTSAGVPLARKAVRSEIGPSDVVVGNRLALTSPTPMRETNSLTSPLVGHLETGTFVEVLEVGPGGYRLRVCTQQKSSVLNSVEGWISSATTTGRSLLSNLNLNCADRSGRHLLGIVPPISNTTQQRYFLQAARAGDVEELENITIQTSEMVVHTAAAENGYCNESLRPTPTTISNSRDVRGRTPLMYAASFGHLNVVRFLLSDSKLHVGALDDTQKTALHHAARRRPDEDDANDCAQGKIIRLLVDADVALEARDHNGCTALLLASATGNLNALRALIFLGANASVTDFSGVPATNYASDFGHVDALMMLEEGVAVSATSLTRKPAKANRGPKTKKRRGSQRRLPESVVSSRGLALHDLHPSLEIAVEAQSTMDAFQPRSVIEREMALRRLSAVMGETTAPRELELAIQAAIDVGAPEEEISSARRRVEALRVQAFALESLLEAIQSGCVGFLREAIQRAEKTGVSTPDLNRARSVLAREEPVDAARQKLKVAHESCDVASLKEALREAKVLDFPTLELEIYENALQGAESKEQAEESLRTIIEQRKSGQIVCLSMLRFAIQEGKLVGADPSLVSTAEQALTEEEPRQTARNALWQLSDTDAPAHIRSKIERASSTGLDCSEKAMAFAKDLLKKVEEIARAILRLREAVDKSRNADPSDVTSLKEAKDLLQNVLCEAKMSGVHEESLKEADVRRKKLHNMIEDLKGAIRVFARVRPSSHGKDADSDTSAITQLDATTLQVEYERTHETFSLDAVFTPGMQDEIFEDCRDLVQSAMDGYNVTIFAYGQTGAGKTFTMYGEPGQEGAAPRTINEIYRLVGRDETRYNHTVMASMLELYRNEFIDLFVGKMKGKQLLKNSGFDSRVSAVQSFGVNNPRHNIHVDPRTKQVFVEDLVEEECPDAASLLDLLRRGEKQRAVAATAMNSNSSRSHLILAIRIIRVNVETGCQSEGKILLCDLAGCERLKKSMSNGDAQKEAIEINKSLTALGDVIQALCNGKSHIPYKNHKLTQLMQDSLGGAAKTLMFVNLSPDKYNADETINALKYAVRAKGITNKVQKNTTLNRERSLLSTSTKSE